MGRQQTKRRRKKYQAGSAYAGDVRPTGVLGFLSGGNMVKVIFIGMALALTIGGAATIFGGNVFRSSSSQGNFVQPDDNAPAATAVGPSDFQVRRYATAPELTIDADSTYTAMIRTGLGEIEVDLLPRQALEAVNNFVFLAQDGFYDGLTFHYVKEGFSAQAGDPACSVAAPEGVCRGNGGPGYELTEDVDGEFSLGTLGMANGSQFFIVLAGSDEFDDYPPFGTITSGLDVAQQLTANTEIKSIEIQVQ